ncbi:hypothetical protein Ddye_007744 [Dipteronia dyeriana]|uniref:Uncharacterized protein n=1 Tax=Dipteronia dyeriana TaxID=168575 RepID=A0AAE0CRY9_9ROSI|nr:hypothetical protein Ddye_007744 [Dipteronia dyeriana]
MANTSLIFGLVRVAVASYKDRRIKFLDQDTDDKYHHNKESAFLIVSKIRGKPSGLGLKARMGTKLAFSVVAMTSWATTESVCRRIEIEQGITGDPEAVVNISAMWLLPQYILSGFGEAFNAIGQNRFFYTEFPKTMSSIATSLYRVGSFTRVDPH